MQPTPQAVKQPDDQALLTALGAWQRLPSSAKGTAGEAWAVAWLTGHGLDVWTPATAGHAADLGVLTPRGLRRVQVRTAAYLPSRQCFRAGFLRRIRGRRVQYRIGEVDFFLLVVP